MPLLQVRDCPEDVYKIIAERARKEHRTIAQQVVITLARGLGLETLNAERRLEVLKRIRERASPPGAESLDDAQLVREDRDR